MQLKISERRFQTMKKTQKLIALIITLSFLLSSMGMFSIEADSNTEAVATQKKQQKINMIPATYLIRII